MSLIISSLLPESNRCRDLAAVVVDLSVAVAVGLLASLALANQMGALSLPGLNALTHQAAWSLLGSSIGLLAVDFITATIRFLKYSHEKEVTSPEAGLDQESALIHAQLQETAQAGESDNPKDVQRLRKQLEETQKNNLETIKSLQESLAAANRRIDQLTPQYQFEK